MNLTLSATKGKGESWVEEINKNPKSRRDDRTLLHNG